MKHLLGISQLLLVLHLLQGKNHKFYWVETENTSGLVIKRGGNSNYKIVACFPFAPEKKA